MKKIYLFFAIIISMLSMARNKDGTNYESSVLGESPKNFKVTEATSASVRFSWTSSYDYDGFVVYIKKRGQNSFTPFTKFLRFQGGQFTSSSDFTTVKYLGTNDGLDVTITNAEIAFNEISEMYVVGRYFNGEMSRESNHIFFGPNGINAAPHNLTVASSNSTSVSLLWSGTGAYHGYVIYAKKAGQNTFTPFTKSLTVNGITSSKFTTLKNIGTNMGRDVTITSAELSFNVPTEVYVVGRSATGILSHESNRIVLGANTIPTRPGIPSITNITSNGCDLIWTASSPIASNIPIVGYFIYALNVSNSNSGNFNAVGFSSTTNFRIDLLYPSSHYNIYIAAMDINGNISPEPTNGGEGFITSGYCNPGNQQHCISASDTYIRKVQFNQTIYPPSPQIFPAITSSYSDYSSNVAAAPVLQITAGANEINSSKVKVNVECDGGKASYMSIFIDYNNNGVFESYEFINSGRLNSKGSGSSLSNDVTVTFCSDRIMAPQMSFIGNVRMRIIYERYGTNVPNSDLADGSKSCEITSYNVSNGAVLPAVGEIQDYLVNIQAGTSPSNNRNVVVNSSGGQKNNVIENQIDENDINEDTTSFKLFPNPVSGDLLNITAVDDSTPYRIMNIVGQEVSSGIVENATINVAKLSQGSYIIELINKDERIVTRFVKQ